MPNSGTKRLISAQHYTARAVCQLHALATLLPGRESHYPSGQGTSHFLKWQHTKKFLSLSGKEPRPYSTFLIVLSKMNSITKRYLTNSMNLGVQHCNSFPLKCVFRKTGNMLSNMTNYTGSTFVAISQSVNRFSDCAVLMAASELRTYSSG
jgi:hypothetical protein